MKRALLYLLGGAEVMLGLGGIGAIVWIYVEAALQHERVGLGEVAVLPLAAVALALPLGIFLLLRKRWAWALNLILVPGLSVFFVWFWSTIDAGTGRAYLPWAAAIGGIGFAALYHIRKEFR